MQSRALESRTAEKFAKVHAEMYVKGTVLSAGGSNGLQEGRSTGRSSGSALNERC